MTASPTVSVLVVSYNTREMTLECLRSVFAETTETSFELIVVDNASSDGSAGAIDREFGDRIRLIRSEENLGFARANNVAARHAAGEFLLLLNPDTVVIDNAIDRLVAFARGNPRNGIWGGRTFFADGSLNPSSCWMRQTHWSLLCQAAGLSSVFRGSRLFNPEAIGGWDRSTVREVDIVSGCFLLTTQDLWTRLGGFDEKFFMYGEEADLCLRGARLGAGPLIDPESTIVHHGGASERVREDKVVRLLAAKHALIEAHFGHLGRAPASALLAAWPLSRFLAHRCAGVFRAEPREDAAQVWREVWRRRREWSGWPSERRRPACST